MSNLPVLPLGEPSFKKIRENNFLYIDKTQQIHKVIKEGGYFFLSRPRRFGKSLLVSTMMEVYKGKKELFKDLWIEKNGQWHWQEHPVILLSFTTVAYRSSGLENALQVYLHNIAKTYDVIVEGENAQSIFADLIKKLYVKYNRGVAVLIDEYDKPLIDYLEEYPTAEVNRKILKGFFGILKDIEIVNCLQIVFITGVSKFSKVSIFSDLNNLTDLTLSDKITDLVGINQSELLQYFPAYIEPIQSKYQLSREKLLYHIRSWYNGYSWDGTNFVYNPYSLLSFFFHQKFGNYWFQSGTPTFLVVRLRRQRVYLEGLENLKVSEHFFNKFELKDEKKAGETIDVRTLLFQTGYLTVKKTRINRKNMSTQYFLSYPNLEVKAAFLHHLIEVYTDQVPGLVSNTLELLQAALIEGDLKQLIQQIETIFSDISHHLFPSLNKKNPTKADKENYFKAWEGYFQTVIYLVIRYLGLQINAELSKNEGRLDAVIEVDNFIYIIEFKLDEEVETAIKQIKDRNYAASYKNSPQKVFLVGICFDSKKRNVNDWGFEEL